MTEQNRFTAAILLSLLLHMALFSMLQARWLSRPEPPPPESLLDVDVVELPPPPPAVKPKAVPQAQPPPPAPPPPEAAPPQTSIVPMPDAGAEIADDSARFLSDRDNKVDHQSVKRGDSFENEHPKADQPKNREPAEAPAEESKPQVAKRVAPAADTRAKPERAAPLPKLDQLLPRIGDLALADKGKDRVDPEPAAPPRRNLLPGKADALSSRSGVAAYLPTVQESDVTLLNTKAAQFAPFVRRVAARIFQHLEINLRQQASGTAAGSGHEYAEVEAVMSKSGERIEATIRKRESDTQLAAYRLLINSTNSNVFFDRNPPPGAAASDGKIHFILVVDLQVAGGADPNTGGRGTSYYGVAAVGLE